MIKHEETAKRILPCFCTGRKDYEETESGHAQDCPAYYWETVAAALAQAEAKGLTKRGDWPAVYSCQNCEALEAEIARLKADNAMYATRIVEHLRRNDDLLGDRDAAEAKGVRMGLERAREAALTAECTFLQEGCTGAKLAVEAIDAEIAKAGGKCPA